MALIDVRCFRMLPVAAIMSSLLFLPSAGCAAPAPAPEQRAERDNRETAAPQRPSRQIPARQGPARQAGALPLYVFEGDSMSVESPRSWPIQLARDNAAVQAGESVNVARRGTKTLLLRRDYLRQVEPIRPAPGQKAIYFLFMGSVDLARDTMPAEDIYQNLAWAWRQARDEGFRVVAFTIKPATGIAGAREKEREKLNRLILADPSRYDALVRTELLLPDPRDRNVILADGMHPTEAGHKRIADAVNKLLGAKTWE